MQKRYLPFAVALLVTLLVLFVHLGSRLTLAAPAFTFADEGREVYLTFDDGPSTVVTGRILDTLKKEGVKATFFVVGERIGGREETLRRIAREGHTLGVHSMSHNYRRIYSSTEEFLKDFKACAALIEETAGVTPRVYRFPGGGTHPEAQALVEGLGYKVASWNAVCGDEEIPNASAKTLVKTTISTSRGKQSVVLLLHDSAPRKATAEALPAIISYFREEGYAFRAF